LQVYITFDFTFAEFIGNLPASGCFVATIELVLTNDGGVNKSTLDEDQKSTTLLLGANEFVENPNLA